MLSDMKHLLTLLILLLTLAVTPTWADRGFNINSLRYVDNREANSSSQTSNSLDQAVEQVRQETGGRVLSARTVRNNGDRIHRIKILTRDRKVKIIRIPASSNR